MFPVHPCSHVQSFSDKAIIEIQRSGPYLQPIQHWSCSAVTVVYRSCVSENGKETAGKTGVCLEIWCHKIQYNPMIHHIFSLWNCHFMIFYGHPGVLHFQALATTHPSPHLVSQHLSQVNSCSPDHRPGTKADLATCPCRSTRALLGQDTWQKVEFLSIQRSL